jgi:hypothetical protein
MNGFLPLRRADVLADSLPDGSAVLYDPCSERVYAISSTAAWVWGACDGTQAIEGLVNRLLETFEADPNTVYKDIGVLLHDLRESGLVEDMGEAGV